MMNFLNNQKIIGILLSLTIFTTSCVPGNVPKTSTDNIEQQQGQGNQGSNPNGSQGALPGGSSGTVLEDDDAPPIIEIRHLVEPKIVDANYANETGLTGAGTYVRKLTIPKNYSGRLYIGGINVSSLADRIIKVRFNFGFNKEPITLNATVAKAPGITPQTPIDVLVLDLRTKPFENIRLMYDLYDYKEYDLPLTSATEFINNNRDPNLFCRGLRLEDDSSFNGQGTCDAAGEQCLYSYAKVVDKSLTKYNSPTSSTTRFPSLPQVDLSGVGYDRDSLNNMVNRCLPQSYNSGSYPLRLANNSIQPPLSLINFTFGSSQTLALSPTSETLIYEGPFKAINTNQWQVSSAALTGTRGIFRQIIGGNLDSGFESYLFPRYTKMDLNANVEHLINNINSSPIYSRSQSNVAGTTGWMDGCNKRVESVNPNGEHIGSCNVSANIQVLARDDSGVEFIVAQSKDVVLQLVRPTQMTEENGDVLFSNFKSCQNSSQCNQSECCFNNRCWSDSLVSQCLENAVNVGNLGNGQNCTSDFQCASLCCNANKCSIHNTSLQTPVTCNKPINAQCLSKEWCAKWPVTSCFIVNTQSNTLGQPTCQKRCFVTYEQGDCRDGRCVEPPPGPNPDFDPLDPEACVDAVPMPNF